MPALSGEDRTCVYLDEAEVRARPYFDASPIWRQHKMSVSAISRVQVAVTGVEVQEADLATLPEVHRTPLHGQLADRDELRIRLQVGVSVNH
jgi:hypothetical protein